MDFNKLHLMKVFQLSTLTWLKKNNLSHFQMVSKVLNTGDIELFFGIDCKDEKEYQEKINDWIIYSEKVERLIFLQDFLKELEDKKNNNLEKDENTIKEEQIVKKHIDLLKEEKMKELNQLNESLFNRKELEKII